MTWRQSASLIDLRDARQFNGLGKRDYVSAYGHLEGATLYGTDLMLNASGGSVKFMAPNTYKALMSAQRIDAAAPVDDGKSPVGGRRAAEIRRLSP
jgi:3-mercaptopyruvate sulfurtransferase SseA